MMAQRRFHYDQAFESYLRGRAIPYIAVDEAKRALHQDEAAGVGAGGARYVGRVAPLKSFDFVVYSRSGPNLLVDVKGRKHTGRSRRSLDNWVTQADIDCMGSWERLFGFGFRAAFAFLYWCQEEPPGALFQDVFECGGRWYAAMAILVDDYRPHTRRRSERWGTVRIPAARFGDQAVPLRAMLSA